MSTTVVPAAVAPGEQAMTAQPRLLGLCLVVIATAVEPFRGDTAGLVAAAGWVTLEALAHARSKSRTSVPVAVILLALWVSLSVAWSGVATASAVGVVQMLLATGAGVHLACRLQLHEIVDGAGRAFKCLLVASWAVGVALPSVGRTQDAYQNGSLEGVFVHRNILGYVGVLALLTFSAQWSRAKASGAPRTPWLLWGLAAFATIVLTNSRTAVVVLATVVGLTVLLGLTTRLPERLRRSAVVAFVLLVLGVALALLRYGAALSVAVGRDPTLTGRTDIWRGVESLIAQRPLVGYGWDALWHPGTQPSEDLWARVGFVFFHAHNGYLDIAAQLGYVGCVLVAAVVGCAVVRAGATFLRNRGGTAAWPLTTCLCLLLFNLTESVLVVHVGWLLLVMVSTRLMLDARAGGRPLPGRERQTHEQLIDPTDRGMSWR